MESTIRYHSSLAEELSDIEGRFVPLASSTRISDDMESAVSTNSESVDSTKFWSNNSTQFFSAQEQTQSEDLWDTNESVTLSWDGYDEGLKSSEKCFKQGEDNEGGLVAAFAAVLGSAAGARRDKDWKISTVHRTVYVKPPAVDGFLPGLIRELAPKPEEKKQITSEQKERVVAGFASSGMQVRIYNACKKWKTIVKKVHKARESQVDAELKVALAGCLSKEEKEYLQDQAQKKKERIKRDSKWEKGIIRMVKYGQLKVEFKEGEDLDTASIIRACRKWTSDANNMADVETSEEALEGTFTPLRLLGGKGSPRKETASGNTGSQTPGELNVREEESEMGFRRGSLVFHSPPSESSMQKTTSQVDRISELESVLVNKLISGRIKKLYVDTARDIFSEIKEMYGSLEKQIGDQGIAQMLREVKEDLMAEIRTLKKEVQELKKPHSEGWESMIRKDIMEELGKVKQEMKDIRESQCAGSMRDATIISTVDGVANKMRGMEKGLEKMRNCIVMDRVNSQSPTEGGNQVEELSWSKVVKRGKGEKNQNPRKGGSSGCLPRERLGSAQV